MRRSICAAQLTPGTLGAVCRGGFERSSCALQAPRHSPAKSNHFAEEPQQRLCDCESHSPYKGGAPAIADVMGGQVPIFFGNMSSALPHVKSGRVRALAVTGSKRSANVPELPTIAESGLPGYEVYEWNGLFAPAGTPASVVNRLQSEIARIVQLPDVSEKLAALGAEAVANTPQEAALFLKAEIAKWAAVVKQANIKAE